MPISLISIKRPVATAMFYIAVSLLGIYAFNKIGVDLLPNINIPHLLVQTTYQNVSPEEIEKLITEPLESACATVTGVKKITSISKEGISVISIDFNWGTNMDFALISVREKLDNVRFMLPREAGRPSIIRVDPSAAPVMTLVLSYNKLLNNNITEYENETKYINSKSHESEIKKLIDLKEAARILFKRRFEQIDGVAQAVITGGLEREILIEVNQQMLSSYNLTISQISASLKSSNINLPAGTIMKGLFRYSLRATGEFENSDEIAKTILKRNPDGSVLFLSDVAVIKESYKQREGLTRYNGAETVGILINKEPESNTVEIASKVKETIQHLKNEYPEYNIQVVSDYSKFIISAIENVKQEIFYGGILAFFVLFFFLVSIRNVLIIGITIPVSLILTILLMYLFNISFNIISLGGIAVGVGMLLDNSIIVIENVTRYKETGMSFREAALRGSNEVAMPIVAATFTTMAVFLPLIFVKGITGELFRDQSYAVIFSLGTSLITALTLIPMLASREKFSLLKRNTELDKNFINIDFNKGNKKNLFKNIYKILSFWFKFPFIYILKSLTYILYKVYFNLASIFNNLFKYLFLYVNKTMEKVINKYEKILIWSLNNRKTVLILIFILVIISVYVFFDIKKEFVPEAPEDEFVVELIYPKGTSLEGNTVFTEKIENIILKIEGVSGIVSNIGRVNEFDFLNKEQISVNKTNLIIKLNSFKDFYLIKEKIRTILNNTKGVDFSFKQTESFFSYAINPSKNDIVIKIKNKDIDEAFEKSELIIKKIEEQKIKGLTELRIGIEKGEPEYNITIDKEKCLAYGITVIEAANQIVNIVKGNTATFLSDFDKKIAVTVGINETEKDDINKILSTEIISGGKKIPIRNLVDYELKESYNEIWREEQSRIIYIYASVSGSSIDKILSEIQKIIALIPKSHGEIINISGVNEEITNSFKILFVAFLISVLLMYAVLASEFESFLFPFIILFSIPLGLIGGIILLYLLGESLSIISIMGLIILIGIADNDAVVKVEFILRKRKEGLTVKEAVLQAGRERFRPIVMNSFTVIFALIPMIIGIGAATQLRVSLSIALAGGLLTSTFLTLIVIPVLYSYLEKFSKKK